MIDDLYLILHRAARAHPGGIRSLARLLGKREKTLYSKLDPSDDTHAPTVGELVALLYCLGEQAQADILDALAAGFGLRVTTRTTDRADSLVAAVLQAVGEHADVVTAVHQALQDGVITADERATIRREIAEARRALSVLENTLTRKGEQ